jgi:hypothetical protein
MHKSPDFELKRYAEIPHRQYLGDDGDQAFQ